MDLPKAAGTTPIEVDVEEGKLYAFCTCGLSATQPFCDGAHKGTEFRSHKFVAEKTGKLWLCMCKKTGKRPFCDGSHSKP